MSTSTLPAPPNPSQIGQDPYCPDTQADAAGGALGMLAWLLRRLLMRALVPWIYPPPGYKKYDYQNEISTPAAGNTATILSITVPNGYSTAINGLSLNLQGPGFVQASGQLVWSVVVNGVPFQGYANILTEFGSVQVPCPITPPILATSGQIINFVIKNVAYASLGTTITARVSGYHYPNPRDKVGRTQW